MSLSSIANLVPTAGLTVQQEIHHHKNESMAKAAEVTDPRFARELEKQSAQNVVRENAPLSLVDKEALATNRPLMNANQTQVIQTGQVRDIASPEEATRVPSEDDEFGFWDLVDLVNPLQHLPLIGTLYRKVTGDEIRPEVQVAGSLLLGAATGSVVLSAASGLAGVIFEEHMGADPATVIAESLFGDDETIEPDGSTGSKIMFADAEMIDPDAPNEAYNLVESKPQYAEVITTEKPEAVAVAAKAPAMSAQLLQEQERMQQMANPASPDFVHDFMMKALDKYKMAHSNGINLAVGALN